MAGEQDGAEQPQEGAGTEQNGGAGQESTERPDDQAGKQPGAGQQSGGTGEQGADGTQQPGEDESKAPSLDDVLKTLPAEQRAAVKAEFDRRDGDLRKARGEARNLRDRVKAAEPKAQEHDAALEAQKTAEQRGTEERDALKNENGSLRQRLVTQEIRVRAAARFADPDDPVGFLKAADLLKDGEPDGQAIDDALDDLLTRKPHLGKPDPKPRPPAPSKAQGSSGGPAPSVDSQAAERRKAGDYTGAISAELSKLTPTK